MQEVNRQNQNVKKEQEKIQNIGSIQELLQQQKSHQEDCSVTIIIEQQMQVLKTFMCQISKRQSQKKRFILNIQTNNQSVLLPLIQDISTVRQLQFTLSKSFSHCLFMNMKHLKLFGYDLDNCEFMGFLDAPQMGSVFLSYNKITNFKSLAKMSLSSLRAFHVEHSLTKKTFLERAKLSKITLSLVLESQNQGFVIEEDLGSLVKFEPQFYKWIIIKSKQRVKRGLIKHKLKKRFAIKQKTVQIKEQEP